MIRSKFRLLSISDHGKGKLVAHLRPVSPRSQWEPEGSEENTAFWEATPSGEVDIALEALPESCREVGAAVYVDVYPVEEADGEHPWHFGDCLFSAWSFNLTLHPKGLAGKVELGITNRSAVALLTPHVAETLRRINEQLLADPHIQASVPWRVVFSAAG